MDYSSQADPRVCPRCGYDLRASTTPRCSECGLAFPEDMWRLGVLRDNRPMRLDAVDPGRPLAVLVAAGQDWLHGLLVPRWLLHDVDPAGPQRTGWLAFVGGLVWLGLVLVIVLTLAILLHTPVSPAAAVRGALLWWLPRLLVVGVAAALCVAPIVLIPACIRVPRLTRTGLVRIGGLWCAVSATAVTVPIAIGALALPEVLLGHQTLFVLLAGLPVAAALPLDPHPALKATLTQRTVMVWAAVAWLMGTLWLAQTLLPQTLTPPIWTYFP